MRVCSCIVIAAAGICLTGCPRDKESESPMTVGEATQALEEASADSQAATLTANTAEISTTFTIGSAVEAAAGEVRDYIQSQMACAEVTLSGHTLTVEYGRKAGNCEWHGQKMTGKHLITITKTDASELVVDHEWQELSNQLVKVTGTAKVTWSGAEKSRRIQHKLTWTRIRDSRSGVGEGDRTQTALAGGILEGIKVDGARSWTGEKGRWDLAIRGVEARWIDPVPQAGSYTLAAPSGRNMTLAFSRVDGDTIQVTVSSGAKSYSFKVTAAGAQPSS